MPLTNIFANKAGPIPLLLLDQNYNDFANASDVTKGSALIGWLRAATSAIGTALSSWLGWQPITPFEFMTIAQIADVQAFTFTQDVTVPMQAFLNACAGNRGRLMPGGYLITSTLTLPKSIRLSGPTSRGVGTPPASTLGAYINAQFAGPAMQYSPGGVTPSDILLEHFQVGGKYTTYGNANGLDFNNTSSVKLKNLVVNGFGTNQISWGNSYSCLARDVYTAETWGVGTANAGIYVNGPQCYIEDHEHDGCKYAVFTDTGGQDCNIVSGVLEGSTVSIVNMLAGSGNHRVINVRLNGTVTGAGITSDAQSTAIIGNKIRVTAGTYGIDLTANSFGSVVVGNPAVLGPTAACRVNNSGLNKISANDFQSAGNGLDMASSTYMSQVTGNWIGGATNSLKHTSGFATYLGNRYDNASGTYKLPTVSAGTPNAEFPVTWTPAADVVAITVNSAWYTRIGDMVHLQFDVTWPATADGTTAKFHNLPWACKSGALTTFGGIGYSEAAGNNQTCYFVDSTHLALYSSNGTTPLTNVNMTTHRIFGSISHMAAS